MATEGLLCEGCLGRAEAAGAEPDVVCSFAAVMVASDVLRCARCGRSSCVLARCADIEEALAALDSDDAPTAVPG